MKNVKELLILDNSPAIFAALAEHLNAKSGFSLTDEPGDGTVFDIVLASEDLSLAARKDHPGRPLIVMKKPLKLGHLIEQIEKKLGEGAVFRPEDITVAPFTLRVSEKLLELGTGAEPLKLTDKELDILLFLHAHLGETVTREDLLDEVFGYAEGVTTHTLETHIYRLRQKITEAGGNPGLIETFDGGYSLNIN